ncbi:hypothetical protein BGZ98_010170 [Dissophora globulifera]|nr:hypothetical protein BGZ98_010170 [Dissophora globulifera]
MSHSAPLPRAALSFQLILLLVILSLCTSHWATAAPAPFSSEPAAEPAVHDVRTHSGTAQSSPLDPNADALALIHPGPLPNIGLEINAQASELDTEISQPHRTHYWKRQDDDTPRTHYWKRQDDDTPRTHYWKRQDDDTKYGKQNDAIPISVSFAPVSAMMTKAPVPAPSSASAKPTKPTTTTVVASPPASTAALAASPTFIDPAAVIAPPTVALPDSPGDTALFGRPMKLSAYNLTLSILINGSITFSFITMLAIGTYKRYNFRKQYRLDIAKAPAPAKGGAGKRGGGDSGGKSGGGDSKSEKPAAKSASETLVKQSSISRVSPNAPSRAPTPRYQDSAPAGRTSPNQYDRQENYGGGRAQQNFQGSRDQYDAMARYRDDVGDSTDYSRPPLTASTTDDAYYAGVVDGYPRQQMSSGPAYQEPRPLQPIRRSDSGRMQPSASAGTAYQGGLERAAPPRIATQGLSGRGPGSGGSPRSGSPLDRYVNGSGSGNRRLSPVVPLELEQYPNRSNSNGNGNNQRMQMRGGYV